MYEGVDWAVCHTFDFSRRYTKLVYNNAHTSLEARMNNVSRSLFISTYIIVLCAHEKPRRIAFPFGFNAE